MASKTEKPNRRLTDEDFQTNLPVKEAIETETPEDTEETKALRDVFRKYINQSPVIAERDKANLLRQLWEVQNKNN